MDSILKPLTLSESKRRWQALLDRRAQTESWLDLCPPGRRKIRHTNDNDDNNEEEEEDNPFDVGSVAIPSVHALVENLLEDFVLQWQQLDFRKITDDNDGTTAANGTAAAGTNANEGETVAKKRRKLWHRNQHLKIPDQFDYATQKANPPSNDQGNTTATNNNATGAGTGARVVNLLDPTQSIPYEQALWELFEQVPTLEDIEAQVREGHQMQHTEQIMTEILEGYQNYTRIDAHSLSQLRINDRHDMPPLFHDDASSSNNNNHKNLTSTIRFECWRKEPTRGPAADPGRAIFEFQGTQTLADVHQTIMELTEDGLWEQIVQDSNHNNDNNTNGSSREPDSGYFLIEDTFYTIGSVDYVTPILNWLGDSVARKAYLGISSSPLQIKPMSEAILQDIPFRLGVRYHHAHHGDVECAIFVTDRHHGNSINQSNHNKKLSQSTKTRTIHPVYPLVHDIWTAPYPSVECEGCQKYTVAVVTSNHCEISQGHRALCQECSDILLGSNSSSTSNNSNGVAEEEQQQNNSAPNNDLAGNTTVAAAAAAAETEEEGNLAEHSSMLTQPYSVWKSQPVLSTGASNN